MIRTLIAAAAAFAAIASASPARACAPVWMRDQRVAVAAEEALIVWEPERKLEHFVRAAAFRAPAGAADAASPLASFGFLVPVPEVPEIAEVGASLLDDVHAFIETKREIRREHTFGGLSCVMLMTARKAAGPGAEPDGVRVLSTARVAGLDAAVLEAENPAALATWLGQHGYDSRPAVAAWIAPYVAARYKIVAFKYAAGGGGAAVASKAVRLSFATDRIFFPYREPDDAVPAPPQRLALYVVAPWKVAGSLMPLPGQPPVPFVAPTRFAGPFDGPTLPFAPSLSSPWLTEIVDEAPTRAGAGDLFFDRAPDEAPVAPPPLVVEVPVPIPIELILIAALLAWAVVRVVRRSRRR